MKGVPFFIVFLSRWNKCHNLSFYIIIRVKFLGAVYFECAIHKLNYTIDYYTFSSVFCWSGRFLDVHIPNLFEIFWMCCSLKFFFFFFNTCELRGAAMILRFKYIIYCIISCIISDFSRIFLDYQLFKMIFSFIFDKRDSLKNDMPISRINACLQEPFFK